ncbi:MAG: hypothetical protein CME54_06340 [Halieaceae bacterium]|nr:hypothetical protein [Halieaceae bacterium]
MSAPLVGAFNFGRLSVITLLSALFGLFFAALLLYLVRRDHLHISHGLGWTLAIVMSAMLGFAPRIFDTVAEGLGVSYAPILGVALAIATLITKALLTDIEISKLRVRHQRLVQKVALLEAQLGETTGRAPIDD